MELLVVNNLKKVYTTRFGLNSVTALNGATFTVERGEYVAVMGESGSGKTTLLNIIAALDKPTSGEVMLDGKNIAAVKESAMTSFRRDNLGFVFQDFNLLDTFCVKDNIFLPLVLSGKSYDEMEVRLRFIAPKLGITDILQKYPYEISGGQKQRVAVARALITSPKLVLADEPTGALDSKNAKLLLECFEMLNKQLDATILMVTHDSFAASYCKRVVFIRDGRVFTEVVRGDATRKQFFDDIMRVVAVIGGDETDDR